MTKTEKELKKEFSAYVKTAIKNTQKQYLIKKGKILDNEIAMDDEGIDEILQKQIEDLFDKMDLNVDMVLSDEINVNSFLDQISLCFSVFVEGTAAESINAPYSICKIIR